MTARKPLNHLHVEVRQTFELAGHQVAAHHRTDIFWRAGIDDVAAISSNASESLLICSATFQIIWFRSAFCLTRCR